MHAPVEKGKVQASTRPWLGLIFLWLREHSPWHNFEVLTWTWPINWYEKHKHQCKYLTLHLGGKKHFRNNRLISKLYVQPFINTIFTNIVRVKMLDRIVPVHRQIYPFHKPVCARFSGDLEPNSNRPILKGWTGQSRRASLNLFYLKYENNNSNLTFLKKNKSRPCELPGGHKDFQWANSCVSFAMG